jgi:hypothetical protein
MIFRRAAVFIVTLGKTLERKILMSIISDIKALQADVETLKSDFAGIANPATAPATEADLTLLNGRVDALEASVGTPDERAAALPPSA